MTGLTELPRPEDFSRVQEMMSEMLAVYPSRPETIAAIVSNALAAPVRVQGPNAALFISGRADTGKTRLTRLGLMWVQPGRISPALDLKSASRQSAAQTLAVEGDIVSLLDDLKVTGGESKSVTESRRSLAHTAISHCYDRKGRAVATVGGTVAGVGRIDASAFITSEVPLEDLSMTTKCVVVPEVKPGEVDFSKVPLRDAAGTPQLDLIGQPVLRSRLDATVERWTPTAGRLFTGYIAWLRERIIESGGLRQWTETNERAKAGVTAQLPAARSTELVGRLVHGWSMFAEYLSENGATAPDLAAHLYRLTTAADEAAEGQSTEARLAMALREALDTKRGYLTNGNGGAPSDYATRVGWVARGMDVTCSGVALGLLSKDATRVLMTAAQAQALLPGVGTPALRLALTAMVPVDEQPQYDKETPRCSHAEFGAQVRGWSIPVAALGLDLTEDQAA